MRTFKSGASRNKDEGKIKYSRHFDSRILKRRGEFMHKHRHLEDGSLREPDNWKKGFPKESYMDSGFRHFMTWWQHEQGYETEEGIEEALCALIFNAEGYLYEILQKENPHKDVWEKEDEVLLNVAKERDRGGAPYFQVVGNVEHYLKWQEVKDKEFKEFCGWILSDEGKDFVRGLNETIKQEDKGSDR